MLLPSNGEGTAARSSCQRRIAAPTATQPSGKRRSVETDEANGTDEDEETPSDADYRDLLLQFHDLNLEDDTARELDIGVTLDAPDDATGDLEDDVAEIDIPTDTFLPESPVGEAGDDEAGLDDLGFHTVELTPVEEPNDDESGISIDGILREPLPPIDADAGDEIDESPAIELDLGTEWQPVEWVDRRYVETSGDCAFDGCQVLAATQTDLYAAGRAIVRISLDGSGNAVSEPIAELEHSVLDLIPFSPERLLCTTTTGHVYWVLGGEVVKVTQHLRHSNAEAGRIGVTQLAAEEGTVRFLLSNGSLLKSEDDTLTFQIENVPELLRLSGGPARLALSGDRDRPLWELTSGVWHSLATNPKSLHRYQDLARSQDSATLLFQAAGDVILIGEAQRGLLLSTDGGASFDLLPGSDAVTAVWAGYSGGRPSAFLCAHRSIEGVTDLLLVDVAEKKLRRLLEYRASEAQPPVERTDPSGDDEETARAIHYEPLTQALWIAFGSGLRRFAPELAQ